MSGKYMNELIAAELRYECRQQEFSKAGMKDALKIRLTQHFVVEVARSVQRGRKSRIPLMVTLGFLGYQWSMESNYVDFLVGDVGCLGVSTRIERLQIRDEYPDDPCSNTVPTGCGQGSTTVAMETVVPNRTNMREKSETIGVNDTPAVTITVAQAP